MQFLAEYCIFMRSVCAFPAAGKGFRRFLSFREAFDAFSSLTGDFFSSDLMCQYHAMPDINATKRQPIRRYNDRKGHMCQFRKLFEFS